MQSAGSTKAAAFGPARWVPGSGGQIEVLVATRAQRDHGAHNEPLMAVSGTELILDRAHNAVISMNRDGLVTYWNPSAERIFGIPRTEAVGRTVADLIIPERLREAHKAGLRRFLAEGAGSMLERRTELAALHRDGSEFPIELAVSAVAQDGEWLFTAFVQDISERRDSERERERLVEELRQALLGSEQRFETTVGTLSDPVTIRDREDRIIYANEAALAHLGFESLEQLRSTPPGRIMADYVVTAEDGGDVPMEQIPSVRLLRGEPAEPLVIRTISRESGAERWLLLKAAPLRDANGDIEATIMVIEDVSAQKRAERRSEFLSRASEILASSLDYEQTLRNVAQLAVPHVVDWCAVDLIDRDGDRVSVAVAHADPARLELAEKLRAYEPERLDPDRGLGLALRTGEPILYPEIDDEMLVRGAVDEHHLALLRSVGFRSAAVVPIRIGRRSLGAMTLVTADSGRVLDGEDVELAEQIAARAAVAMENSRIYSERSEIAHTLQQSLLPDVLPHVPGYELASVYVPALESTEVGGDFYDAWESGNGWIVTVGDVTGKGVEAATLTSLVRHTLRATAEFVSSPAELLRRLDVMLKRHEGAMCTALCMRLDGDSVTLAVGGHPLPIYVDERGVREVGEHGPLLGAFETAAWQDVVLDVDDGATLVMFTDGVTDAVGGDGDRFGFGRLRATLDRCRTMSAPELIESLAATLQRFQVGEHADDMAALALRRVPGGASAHGKGESRRASRIQSTVQSS